MIVLPSALESPLAEGRAQGGQVAAVLAGLGRRGVGRRAAGQERRTLGRRAVAVDALDLDGRADLAVELGVAVHVLDEVAVDAVHPLFEVDVELMDGQPVALRLGAVEGRLLFGRGVFGAIPLFQLGRHADRRHQRRGGIVGDRLASVVEQLAVPVFLEDGAEDPAVAMEVGELRVLRLGVQVGDAFQERRVGPVALAPRSRRGSTSSSG